MTEPTAVARNDAASDPQALAALALLYHRCLTGLLLALASRAGTERAARVVFHAFRRQQQEKFLAGLDKLGLRQLPHAVACAQYHVLSNVLGGAKVEWIPQHERKSWVRYAPPRWIFDGTAICGIPSELSRAMLLGWHANNGVLLGNPRLGFVCTSQTTDGGAGAIGYYIEEERELAPEERLRFAPGELPPGRAVALPGVDWEPLRRARVSRNYAMEYVRSLLDAMCRVLGPADAGHIGRIAARQVGMQYHDELCALLAHDAGAEEGATSCARLLLRLLQAHGDTVECDLRDACAPRLRQCTWRFGAGLGLPPEGFEAWNGLWEGIAAVHGCDNGHALLAARRLDLGDDAFEWRIIGRNSA